MNFRFLLLSLFLFFSLSGFSQAPDFINYQAVARDNAGKALKQTAIQVVFLISNNSAGTNPLWQETQTTTTNDFGLFTLEIGKVNSLVNFNWNGPRFLEVKVGASGNTPVSMGIDRIISVPYALYAAKADSAKYVTIPPPGSGWALAGNTILNSTSNFIGTLNNQDFVLKANGSEKMRAKSSGGILVKDTLHIGSTSSSFSKNFEQVLPTLPIANTSGYTLTKGSTSMMTFAGAGVVGPSGVGAGIGTITNDDFHLFTTSQARLSIDKNGSVGIGATGYLPHPSSILEVASTNKGVLIPRMPAATMQGISPTTPGLLVYNTSANQFFYHNGTTWVGILSSSNNSGPWTRSTTSPNNVYLVTPSDNVTIGTTTTTSNKLEVLGKTRIITQVDTLFGTHIQNFGGTGDAGALNVINTGLRTDNHFAVKIDNNTTGAATSATKTALGVNSIGTFAGTARGIYVNTNGSPTLNVGVSANALGTGALNYGMYASAANATTNWAGYFEDGNVYIKNNLKLGATSSSFKNKLLVEGSFGVKVTELNGATGNTIGSNTVIVEIKNGASAPLLPPTNSVDDGTILIVRSRTTSNLTITSQSGDVIEPLNSNVGTTIPIGGRGSVRLYKMGNAWIEF